MKLFRFLSLTNLTLALSLITSTQAQSVSKMSGEDLDDFLEYLDQVESRGPVQMTDRGSGVIGMLFHYARVTCHTAAGGGEIKSPGGCTACIPFIAPTSPRIATPYQTWATCAQCVTAFPGRRTNQSIGAICGLAPTGPGSGNPNPPGEPCPYPNENC